MKRFILHIGLILAFVLCGVFATGPAWAEKPSWAGGKGVEKHKQKALKEKGDKGRDQGVSGERGGHGVKASKHFTEENRISIHNYYGGQFRSGHCPPGLAKKGNGCMPPGQAKKWTMGHPLPRDVIFYDLPSSVLVQLGPVPLNHRFVRVAADILLIATGTGMVVDAIEDIGMEMNR